MKERGIVMSAQEVRATLDGRKTQFRRVMKVQPTTEWPDFRGTLMHHVRRGMWRSGIPLASLCPFGVPGDRLFVKETFSAGWLDSGEVIYRATAGLAKDAGYPREPKYSPATNMPRRFSRLTLEITEVRAQRLQEISEDDARAEGTQEPSLRELGGALRQAAWSERQVFQRLWDSMNPKHPWQNNDWIWAITYKRLP